MKRYVLGLDFGTLSARALLVEADSGRECATLVHEYEHRVLDRALPGSRKLLPPETALQHPADYLAALGKIRVLLRRAKIRAEQVVGIGTDFTCCTMLPVLEDGTPLCLEKRWQGNPHAWVKLWKHHAAQPEANEINELGAKRGERFVRTYGGKYSSEWFFSKVLETVKEAPGIYDGANGFIEAGDWIVWQLCGEQRRSLSAAGFKAMRVYPSTSGRPDESRNSRANGVDVGWTFPGREFFGELHPKLANVVSEKLSGEFFQLGTKAGGLTERMAKLTGLKAGTPVAVGNIDAHVAVPACGVTEPGKMVMIMGTSTCHLLLSDRYQEVEGICGVVEDGIVPGLWGYEAGQAGVGDVFAWHVEQAVPPDVHVAARKAGRTVHEQLEREAAKLVPGQSGLLALDWWNGNRSVLVDADLSGMLVGATLSTRPHEIYRALIEGTAYGTRRIIEAFTSGGVRIDELYACGGLAQKNRLLMQIYSDVTGRPIWVAESEQTCALGAAMQGAVAAGVYPDIQSASRKMVRRPKRVFKPDQKAGRIYDRLYQEYLKLHDQFGRDAGSVMKVLKGLRTEVSDFV